MFGSFFSAYSHAGQGHRVVVVGGGFGGLSVALRLRRVPVQIRLIDRRNFHLFQPLLYQVATGALSPANIAAPLRKVFGRQKNCDVLLDAVTGFDFAKRQVHFKSSPSIGFDTLVVAAGASHSYFGNPHWEQFAPGLKTIEDATEIRRRILSAFESADRETDPMRRKAWLRFVIVGAGPTGVEMAGAVAELSRHTLRNDFRHIDPADAEVILVEAGPKVLGAFPDPLPSRGERSLQRLAVIVRTQMRVADISDESVELESMKEPGKRETILTRTVLWAAGVQAAPLATRIVAAANELGESADKIQQDRAGRIIVRPDCSLPGLPDVFVIGDMANYPDENGKPLPGIAPVAMQQGKFVATLLRNKLKGKPAPAFVYRDPGTMATIGRSAAVAHVFGLKFSGVIAWLLWLFVHLMYIVTYRNRVLVLIQWSWSYLTWDRSARLITGPKRQHAVKDQAND